MLIFAVDAHAGVGIGLVLTALGFGFRHGIDWDHLAALSDITASQDRARRSMALATLYALGHALVVFALGALAILLSAELPRWVDGAMERVVGATLLALGAYVLCSLARHGRDFRMRSRWMLIFAAARRGARWARTRRRRDSILINHEHTHPADESHDHEHADDEVALVTAGPGRSVATVHRHVHRHVGVMPDDPFPAYGRATAFGVGMLHGIGAETPTQVIVFAAAAGAGGAAAGIFVLGCFIAGLIASNSAVALAATFGFLGAARNFRLYAAISVVTAVFSLLVGTLFLLGLSAGLPAMLGG
jgi:high-affinity nickel-transport protein